MKKLFLLFFFCAMTLSTSAVSLERLRSFFSEYYVQLYFKNAHHNARAFDGVEIDRITENRVTIKATFQPTVVGSLFGGSSEPYTCTIYIDIDNHGRFMNVTSNCHSTGRRYWSCFSHGANSIKTKCRSQRNNSSAIDFMEDHFGCRLREFTGSQAFCTLLNIAWFNYDY